MCTKYVKLNADNVIIGYYDKCHPVDAIRIEIEDGVQIHCNFDKVIDGIFVPDVEGYAAFKTQQDAEIARLDEIADLKKYLQSTDYQAIKLAEGAMTAEEYQPVKEQRAAARARINELEAENN